MAATGHFYKTSADGGAAQLDNSVSSLIDVLDWALDTAGATYWEKVYTGTNKAVFRSKTGNRPYLRVDDTYGATALVQMFETMSDVDTGTGQCPNGVNQATANFRVPKADNANANAYHIVGDSQFFLLINHRDDTYPTVGLWTGPFYFGDMPTYDSLDTYNSGIGATLHPSNNADYNDVGVGLNPVCRANWAALLGGGSTTPHPSNSTHYSLRTADGTVASSGGLLVLPWHGADNAGMFAYTQMPTVFYAPCYILCSDYSTSISYTGWFIGSNVVLDTYMRLRVPYLYNTPIAGATGIATDDVITVGAETFVALSINGTTQTGDTHANSKIWLIRTSDDEPDRA